MKHGIQKINFTRLFIYYGYDGRMKQSSPQTSGATIKAAIPFADLFEDIARVELRDLETHKKIDEYIKNKED